MSNTQSLDFERHASPDNQVLMAGFAKIAQACVMGMIN